MPKESGKRHEGTREYQGPDGWKQAQADLETFRQEAREYLRERKGVSERPTPLLHDPSTPIQEALGVSYDLIDRADSPEDYEMIRRLAILSRSILFSGNAMNFSETRDHERIAGIERETRAFITGLARGEELSRGH